MMQEKQKKLQKFWHITKISLYLQISSETKNKDMINKCFSLALLLNCLLLVFASCSDANAKKNNSINPVDEVTKNISIGDFDKIEVSCGINVVFRQAANPGRAAVVVAKEYEDRLMVVTDGNKLKISYSENGKNMNNGKGSATVTVSSLSLREVDASSAANVTVMGNLNLSNEMDIEASSAAKVTLGKVKCQKLDVETSSSACVSVKSLTGNLDVESSSASSVDIESVTGNVDVEASSASDVNVKKAQGEKIEVKTSSASKVSVDNLMCNLLEAEASSGSKITFGGVCNDFVKKESSGGFIKRSNLLVKGR